MLLYFVFLRKVILTKSSGESLSKNNTLCHSVHLVFLVNAINVHGVLDRQHYTLSGILFIKILEIRYLSIILFLPNQGFALSEVVILYQLDTGQLEFSLIMQHIIVTSISLEILLRMLLYNQKDVLRNLQLYMETLSNPTELIMVGLQKRILEIK